MHRIIVVGGGAGGLELATRLGDRVGAMRDTPKAQIILVDRNPTHIWKPLLHEVAAGSMDPFTHQLEYAAQARWHGFEFQQGQLIGLDRGTKTIRIGALIDHEDGVELLPERTLAYDSLVIAVGSTTHFFGVAGAEENAIALDTVWQAERFRRRLIAVCMRAQNVVEPAAVITRDDVMADVGITLIESGERILPALPERVSTSTTELLGKLGVKVCTGERVIEVTPDTIRTASGNDFTVDLTVWAAGIKAPAVLSELDGLAVNRLGQLNVRATLQTETDDNIFALGDCAACAWPEEKRNVPPRAQAAHQQASFLLKALEARLAGKTLPEFRYRDFGSLVSLGHMSAVGNLMGGVIGGNMLVEGLFARFMYMSLYRLHIAALHGWPRMMLDTLAHWLHRSTLPRVKLH